MWEKDKEKYLKTNIVIGFIKKNISKITSFVFDSPSYLIHLYNDSHIIIITLFFT